MLNASMNKLPENYNEFPVRDVLVVDDEEAVRNLVNHALVKSGYTCETAANAELALERIHQKPFDLIISDISMPGMDGMELLEQVKHKFPEIDVIIMTGYGSRYSYVDIMNAGASDYMEKPFSINAALARITRIAREKSHLIRLKGANQELTAAKQQADLLAKKAEDASKAKTFFLASMSHEIRTPLNGIVGYTDMLSDTKLDDEQQSFLKNARFSCDTLLSVVNDILDFSKVEAGKLQFETIAFDPEVLCFDIIDAIRSKVDESKVELVCHVSDDVPDKLMGDPHRFRQVILNLLGNAAKFTQQGFIRLVLDAEQMPNDTENTADDDHIMLTVQVQDSGIGIDKEKLHRIFNPFIQSEDSITSAYGGTGLGLSISREIARQMGGDIAVESSVDKGSIFHFSSTLKKADTTDLKPSVRPVALKDKRVLVVTSSNDTREILTHSFKTAGMQITHIEPERFDSFFVENKDQVFDVGVIDFGGMLKRQVDDEAIKTLLADQWHQIGSNAFGISFIAYAVPFPGIAKRFHKAGFKGFLPKPASQKKIYEMLSYVMGIDDDSHKESQPPQPVKEIVTSHMIAENKKYNVSILLVEDNKVNQKIAKLILEKVGYTVDVAVHGKEAVEKYTSDHGVYDLILMDINMPEMNGFEATSEIRRFESENQNAGRVPIIALTANVIEGFKGKCLKVGMDDYLTKPIKRDLVFQTVQKWAHS